MKKKLKALVLYVPTNRHGLNERTGRPWHDGDEFKREATHFACYYDATLVPIPYAKGPISKKLRLETVKSAFEQHSKDEPFDVVAVFCHGWANGIQLGYKVSDSTVDFFAELIHTHCAPNVKVELYCCSTAHDRDKDKGEEIGPGSYGGFASELHTAMCEYGVDPFTSWVDAHFTAGHTTRNPFLVRFNDKAGVQAGKWLVKPNSRLWPMWRKSLKGGMRFMLAMLTTKEIEQKLSEHANKN